ncbi:MAG TPA: NAD(P)/FAD-dependent oxidoreductase [Candidatus Methanoperedens sp.]
MKKSTTYQCKGLINSSADANRTVESADAVVIGAGIGGLSAAAYLARAGRKVIVFEQDRHVGGTAHVFRRNGFTFPTGPQSFTMPSYLADSLRELGVEQPPDFIRDNFQVRRGAMDVMISVPMHQLAKRLIEYFPQEEKGILAVINILGEIIAALEMLKPEDLVDQTGTTHSAAPAVLERWGKVPAKKLLDKHLKDRYLKDILGSQGTSEPVMSVVLLSQMWRFMSREGIWHTKGGIGVVPELLAAKVRAFGGEIWLGKRVERILVHKGAAAGVELEGGALIKSPIVISDADYKETILKLLPRGTILADEQEAVSRMPLTPSAFTVFLGVKKELVDLSAFRANHLLVKLKEGEPVQWEQKRACPEDFLQDELWLSWWSRHDPQLAPPGCEALIIKVSAPYGIFAPFSEGGYGHHHERYYLMKEKIADALIGAAANVMPGLPGAVMVRKVATPLTYQELGHRSEGSIAGWSWRFGDYPEPWARSFAITKISGLLMVGLQSFTRLFYGGMGTAMYSGRYAADIVLSGAGYSRAWTMGPRLTFHETHQ